MGVFGWIDCNADPKRTNKPNNIVSGNKENFYVLLPEDIKDKILEEFPRTKSYYNKGNNSLIDYDYNGYGNMGGLDVYELIAFMNVRCSGKTNEELISYLEKPRLEQYGGLWQFDIEDLKKAGKTDKEIEELDRAEKEKHYNKAMSWYEKEKERLILYKETGKCENKDDLREIGIDIGCYDRQMARLPYQFKVTYDSKARYEDCKFSPSDPCQSWGWIRRGELIDTLRDRDKAIKEAEKELERSRGKAQNDHSKEQSEEDMELDR